MSIKGIRRASLLFLFIIVMVLSLALPVYAAPIPAPDTFMILQIEAYRNCIEPLDQLYLVSAIASYTTPPTTYDASEAFIIRLMNGGVELGATTFYATGLPDNGYTRQLAAIYFSAASAPAWAGAYTVRIDGNPLIAWAGAPPLVQSAVFSTWYDDTSVASTQNALAIRLGVIATQLQTAWGVGYELVEDTASGKKLTDFGESYFTNTIPNLSSICPAIFSASLSTPNYDENLIIQNSYMGGDDTDYDVYGVNWYAQTFNATRQYYINGAWVKVFRTAAPGTFTLSLRATLAGVPTGADLASGTLAGNQFSLNTDGEWEWLTFTDHYQLTAGTTYALVARATAGNANNYVGWRVDTAGNYPAGQGCVSVNSGVAWAALGGGTRDFMFSVTGDDVYSLSYRDRLAATLIGTPFDMTNLGANFGMSRMWMTFLVYVAFCFALTASFDYYAMKAYKPGVTLFVFCLLMAMGTLIGAIYIEIGGLFILGVVGAAIYVILYEKT